MCKDYHRLLGLRLFSLGYFLISMEKIFFINAVLVWDMFLFVESFIVC